VQRFIKLSAAVHELSTQLQTLIANISGTHQAIDKWKTALSTTIFSTFDESNFVNSSTLTKKMALTFDL